MRATELLLAQHQTIHNIFHEAIDDLTDEEWTARVLPKANLPATELWHVARALDAYTNTAVRGVPQVYDREPWASMDVPALFGLGVEMPLEEADAIARGIRRADAIAYADAVWDEVRAWMATLSDDDLDAVPDVVANFAANPRVGSLEYVKLVEENFAGLPAWRFVSNVVGGHRRDHLIEVLVTKDTLRARVAATAAARTMATPELVAVGAESVAAPPRRRRWPWGRR